MSEDRRTEWIADRTHVLESLERFERKIDSMLSSHGTIKEDLAVLKYKSSLWGGLSGIVSALLVVIPHRWLGKP